MRRRIIKKSDTAWRTVIGSKQVNCYIGNVVGGVAPCITSACGCGGGMIPMLTNIDIERVNRYEFIKEIQKICVKDRAKRLRQGCKESL